MKYVCCHGSQEANNKRKHQYKLAVGNICLTPFVNSTYYIAIILVCHFSSLLLYIDMYIQGCYDDLFSYYVYFACRTNLYYRRWLVWLMLLSARSTNVVYSRQYFF